MSSTDPAIDWQDLEQRLGLSSAERFARDDIARHIQNIPVARRTKNGKRENPFTPPLALGLIGFGATFMGLMFVAPSNFWGGLLQFVLFIPLFLIWIGISLCIFRNRIIAGLLDGQNRFLARAKAMSALSRRLGLAYSPSPGGAPKALELIAQSPLAPVVLKDAAALLDTHGGLDEPLAIARRSGAMVNATIILGTQEQRQQTLSQVAEQFRVEDGFQGERSGVPFSAFEWVQPVEDAPDVFHLVMVFKAPLRLQGVTQLRSRYISWPAAAESAALEPVDISAPAFKDRFRVRSTDQLEARAIFDPAVIERVSELAKGEKVRAAAFDDHLVIDVEGEDRFAMINILTGEWSEATIASAMLNVADLLDLADAVAHAFRLRAET